MNISVCPYERAADRPTDCGSQQKKRRATETKMTKAEKERKVVEGWDSSSSSSQLGEQKCPSLDLRTAASDFFTSASSESDEKEGRRGRSYIRMRGPEFPLARVSCRQTFHAITRKALFLPTLPRPANHIDSLESAERERERDSSKSSRAAAGLTFDKAFECKLRSSLGPVRTLSRHGRRDQSYVQRRASSLFPARKLGNVLPSFLPSFFLFFLVPRPCKHIRRSPKLEQDCSSIQFAAR